MTWEQLDPKAQLERAQREGWIYDGSIATEGEVLMLLHTLVLSTKPTVCIETGTYTGKAAEAIGQALDANEHGELFTIEIDAELVANHWKELKPRAPRVKFICADSVTWLAENLREIGPVDFAFIDSGEPDVRLGDVGALWPHLTQGALMAVHDTAFYPGLTDAVKQLVTWDHTPVPHVHVPTLNGLGIWQKL